MQTVQKTNYINLNLKHFNTTNTVTLNKAITKPKIKLNKALLLQRVLSIVLILISILTVKILSDATISIITIPLSIVMLVSKKTIIKL